VSILKFMFVCLLADLNNTRGGAQELGAVTLAQSLFSSHLTARTTMEGRARTREGEGAREGSAAAVVVQNIVFLGDSVSSQLAQFLICDLLREGQRQRQRQRHGDAPAVTDASSQGRREDIVVRSFNRTVASFMVRLPGTGRGVRERRGLLRVHSQQFNLPCLQNNRSGMCHLPRDQTVFEYVTALLDSYTALSLPPPVPPGTARRTVLTSDATSFRGAHMPTYPHADTPTHTMIVFNYGLHIPRKYAWIIRPMATALLQWAKAVPRHVMSLNYRETSSQSFTGSPGEVV
jgi:hypothetical protein